MSIFQKLLLKSASWARLIIKSVMKMAVFCPKALLDSAPPLTRVEVVEVVDLEGLVLILAFHSI